MSADTTRDDPCIGSSEYETVAALTKVLTYMTSRRSIGVKEEYLDDITTGSLVPQDLDIKESLMDSIPVVSKTSQPARLHIENQNFNLRSDLQRLCLKLT